MKDLLIGIIVGVLICIVGVVNLKGNLTTLKRHHRRRVAEEDKPAMGKIVGTGTLIMGFCMLEVLLYKQIRYIQSVNFNIKCQTLVRKLS